MVDPLGWGSLRKLKVGGTDTNQSLLGAGVTDALEMQFSLPVLLNRACPDFTGLVIDRAAIVSVVGPVMIAMSDQTYFTDSVALRATWRIGHVLAINNRGSNNGELRAAHLIHNQRRNRKRKPVVRHSRQW